MHMISGEHCHYPQISHILNCRQLVNLGRHNLALWFFLVCYFIGIMEEELLSPDKYWAEQCDNVSEEMTMKRTKALFFIKMCAAVCL